MTIIRPEDYNRQWVVIYRLNDRYVVVKRNKILFSSATEEEAQTYCNVRNFLALDHITYTRYFGWKATDIKHKETKWNQPIF